MFRQSVMRALTTALVLIGASAAVVMTAPAASAAAAPTLSPATVQRGAPTTMSGTGCVSPAQPLNPAMVIVTGGAFAGYATATPTDGNWSMSVDVGEQIGPGNFAIKARCSYPGSGGFDYPAVTLTVVGEPLPPKPWEIPPPPGGHVGPAPTGVPSPLPPSAARTSAPSRPAPTASPSGTPVPSATTAPVPAPDSSRSPATPTAASGCSDCAKLGADEPVRAGEKLALRYAGFEPGERITVVMHSAPVTLGTFTADADGLVTANVTVPAAESGAHTLTLSGPVTGDLVIDFRLAAADRPAVAVAPATDAGRTLPFAVGGAVLVLLIGALLVHRRRRTAARDTSDDQEAATPIAAPTA